MARIFRGLIHDPNCCDVEGELVTPCGRCGKRAGSHSSVHPHQCPRREEFDHLSQGNYDKSPDSGFVLAFEGFED